MTFRARPTTRTGRRSGYESDARRNLYFNIGFGAVVLVAILLLVGAGAASWYNDHLAPVAKVNGQTITKDDLNARIALETFRLDTLESRTREKVNAGRMSASQGTQLLNYISQQKQQIVSAAYEREIDSVLLMQLAPKQGVQATPAEVDAQVAKDATTPESRHTYQITVKPETGTGASEPTQAQKDAARTKANGLLADLKGGKTWEDVVKASGDADAADTNGDLYFLDKGTTYPDTAFANAISCFRPTIGAPMRASSLVSASTLLSAEARSNWTASPRTSAASCSSAPSEATLETTPRSDITACSSCLNARGSFGTWAEAAIWSILWESACTASWKPPRFSAGIRCCSAPRTSASSCSMAERSAPGAPVPAPACRVRSSFSDSACTSPSSASMARRGSASVSARPISARSPRSASSAFS